MAQQADRPDDKEPIEKAIASYVAAFNKRDAATVAAHWSPEAVYTSRFNGGDQIVGRAALEEEFKTLFAEQELKLEVTTESIEFISPNVALEVGSATVTRPDQEPEKTSYQVVHVKRDGKWLVDRITEEVEDPEPASHYEQLKDLEWMVGEWVDQDGGEVITTECNWARNQNFLIRAFTTSAGERVDFSGMQFIGWDAARRQIRSWVFDSDGGVAEGHWQKQGDHWIVQTRATLPDGSLASSTSIIRPIDADSFGWQQVNRTVAGEILPNIDEVVIVRK